MAAHNDTNRQRDPGMATGTRVQLNMHLLHRRRGEIAATTRKSVAKCISAECKRGIFCRTAVVNREQGVPATPGGIPAFLRFGQYPEIRVVAGGSGISRFFRFPGGDAHVPAIHQCTHALAIPGTAMTACPVGRGGQCQGNRAVDGE
jgi:hypothetical protein